MRELAREATRCGCGRSVAGSAKFAEDFRRLPDVRLEAMA